jgi:toxin ParE1/3/4
MTVKAVLLQSAESDLKDLRSYVIKNFGKDSWLTSFGKIKESIALIQSFPEGGRIPDELANLHLAQYRQVISGMNRIIYEVRSEVAYIHVICDVRKDLRSLLMKRILHAV